MNANEENKRAANELNVEELGEIAGGKATTHICICPRCNRAVNVVVVPDQGSRVTLCPYCKEEGVDSPMVGV